jgi:hypothetical protein
MAPNAKWLIWCRPILCFLLWTFSTRFTYEWEIEDVEALLVNVTSYVGKLEKYRM